MLAVSPLFQLVPKQDLAPLAGIASFAADLLDPLDFVSTQSRDLLHSLEERLSSDPDFLSKQFTAFAKDFEEFDDPALAVFRTKPIPEGEDPPKGPHAQIASQPYSILQPYSAGLSQPPKKTQNLFKVPDLFNDRLIFRDKQDILDFAIMYKDKLAAAMGDQILRKRASSPKSDMPTRKRVNIDHRKFADGKIRELVALVDELETSSIVAENGISQTQVIALHKQVLELQNGNLLSLVDTEDLHQAIRFCVQMARSSSDPLNSILLASSMLYIINNTSDTYVHSHLTHIIDKLVHLKPSPEDSSDTLIYAYVECLKSFLFQLDHTVLEEQVLCKIEYMCIESIFSFSVHASLRNALIALLIKIFTRYPSQRQFLIQHMLERYLREKFHKSKIRQVQILDDIEVLFFALFLVNLVQSTNILSVEKHLKAFVKESTSNKFSISNLEKHDVIREILKLASESESIARQISEYMLNSLESTSQNLKNLFITVVEDIANLIPLVNMPGAETLACVMSSMFSQKLLAKTLPPTIEPFLLDMTGKLGLSFVELKIAITKNFSSSEAIQVCTENVIEFLSKSQKQPSPNSELLYQSVKILAYQARLLEPLIVRWRDPTYENPEGAEASIVDDILKFVASISRMLKPSKAVERCDTSGTAAQSYRTLLWNFTMARSHAECLNLLASLLTSNRPKTVAKAVKLLSSMIELDSSVLLHSTIGKSLAIVSKSQSAISRDAVVELLGQYMFSSEDLLQKYHKVIGECANDSSISIRKRVLRIMRAIFDRSSSLDLRSYAVSVIIRRFDDEDQNLAASAKQVLQEIFSELNLDLNADIFIRANSHSSSLRKILRSFLHETRVIPRDVLTAMLTEMCDRIVEDRDSSIGRSLQAVSTLIESYPDLMSQDQLIAIQSYLICDESDQNESRVEALRIVRLSLNQHKILRPDFKNRLHSAIMSDLTRFNTKEVHEAVQILSLISTGQQHKITVKAAISCMTMLRTHAAGPRSELDPIALSRICKLLHLLGCFGSYCSFEDARELFVRFNYCPSEKETVLSLMTRYLLLFCSVKFEVRVRNVAFENLLNVAAAHPHLFLHNAVLQTIDDVFASDNSASKSTAAIHLTKLIAYENEQTAKRVSEKLSEPERDDFLSMTKGDTNEGICSSLVQRYTQAIADTCLLDASELGESLVNYLNLVASLGYANPKLWIGTIIALEASPNKKIRRTAICLHREIFDKHESLADWNYAGAVRAAASYSKAVLSDEMAFSKLFLRDVYSVINKSYLARKKLVVALTKTFGVDITSNSLQSALEQRYFLVFLAENLLKVEFASMEEVYFVIFRLDENITREGLELAERVSLTVGDQSGDKMSLENLQKLFVYAQSVLSLMILRDVLASSYGIRPSLMEAYRPGRMGLELRHQPKIFAPVEYPVDDLFLKVSLNDPASFGKVFTALVLTARKYVT